MRQVQVVVPAGQGWTIIEKIGDDYPYIELVDGRTSDLVYISVSDGNTDPLIRRLMDLGISLKHGTITVVKITARLPNMAQKARGGEEINREEIYEDMQEVSSIDFTFISYVILSAFIASIGVISDNIVILIASMIIAPLMGPMAGTSFGILTNDHLILKRSLRKEILGFSLTILVGVIVAMVIPVYTVNSSMYRTATITVLDLSVALVGGIAVGVSTTSRRQSELIGIAVAASICPPAAAVGIHSLKFFQISSDVYFNLSLGSVSLLFANILSIHLTTLVIFWLQGVKPTAKWKQVLSKGTIRRRMAMALLLISLIGIPIGIVSYDSYRQWRDEASIQRIIYDQIDKDNILDIEINQRWTSVLLPRMTTVNITIQLINASYSRSFLETTKVDIKQKIESTVYSDMDIVVNIKLLLLESISLGD